MPGPLADVSFLLAQAKAAAPAAQPDSTGSILSLMIPLLAMIILYQVLIGGPQRKVEAKRRALIAALKKNDRVLTSSGIFGTVVSADPESDRVTLRVDDERGVRMEFSKAAITQVLNVEKESDKSAALAKK
jgi:preprotein translocase subunit YajC